MLKSTNCWKVMFRTFLLSCVKVGCKGPAAQAGFRRAILLKRRSEIGGRRISLWSETSSKRRLSALILMTAGNHSERRYFASKPVAATWTRDGGGSRLRLFGVW